MFFKFILNFGELEGACSCLCRHAGAMNTYESQETILRSQLSPFTMHSKGCTQVTTHGGERLPAGIQLEM